jgi:hypothetical protein
MKHEAQAPNEKASLAAVWVQQRGIVSEEKTE